MKLKIVIHNSLVGGNSDSRLFSDLFGRRQILILTKNYLTKNSAYGIINTNSTAQTPKYAFFILR